MTFVTPEARLNGNNARRNNNNGGNYYNQRTYNQQDGSMYLRCYRIHLKDLATLALGVGDLPHKTELKLYFKLGLNRLSVVRSF
jgi:hypothetical protein